MDYKNIKCVIVIDKELPLGLIANASAILGCSLGKYVEEIVGSDVIDKSNYTHKGIISTPLPILSSTKCDIKKLYNTLMEEHFDQVTVIGFNNIAQQCKTYEDYTQKLSNQSANELDYLGICIYGDKKIINKTTGSLPTLK